MDGGAIAPQQQMSDGRPPRALLQASLRNSIEQDAELKAPAHSDKTEDGQQALALFRALAESAPPDVLFASDWGRSDAIHSLRKTDGEEQASAYNNQQLLRAPSFCIAEFRVSRRFALRSMRDFLFAVSIPSETQFRGRRQGRQLGLISSTYEATKFNGAHFCWAFASCQCRGLHAGASMARLMRAFDDDCSFPPSLHLLAHKSGAWPIKMLGAQTPFSQGWITSYLISFSTRLLLESEFPVTRAPSLSDSSGPDSQKRERRRCSKWKS